MRATHFSLAIGIVVVGCALGGCQSVPPSGEVSFPTKQQWVRYFGFPARITIDDTSRHFTEAETWYYYYQLPNGVVAEYEIGFHDGRMSSFGGAPDPSTVLSPDREPDLSRIRDYLRHQRKRAKNT